MGVLKAAADAVSQLVGALEAWVMNLVESAFTPLITPIQNKIDAWATGIIDAWEVCWMIYQWSNDNGNQLDHNRLSGIIIEATIGETMYNTLQYIGDVLNEVLRPISKILQTLSSIMDDVMDLILSMILNLVGVQDNQADVDDIDMDMGLYDLILWVDGEQAWNWYHSVVLGAIGALLASVGIAFGSLSFSFIASLFSFVIGLTSLLLTTSYPYANALGYEWGSGVQLWGEILSWVAVFEGFIGLISSKDVVGAVFGFLGISFGGASLYYSSQS